MIAKEKHNPPFDVCIRISGNNKAIYHSRWQAWTQKRACEGREDHGRYSQESGGEEERFFKLISPPTNDVTHCHFGKKGKSQLFIHEAVLTVLYNFSKDFLCFDKQTYSFRCNERDIEFSSFSPPVVVVVSPMEPNLLLPLWPSARSICLRSTWYDKHATHVPTQPNRLAGRHTIFSRITPITVGREKRIYILCLGRLLWESNTGSKENIGEEGTTFIDRKVPCQVKH